MKNCIFIDGNSLLYRMFYGSRPMSSPAGAPTGAVFGFVNVLLKLKNDYDPAYWAVAFDLPQPTFRHEAYEAYKAGREKMPEDLAVQLTTLKTLLAAMDVPVVTCEGYEADDVLGTLGREAAAEGFKTYLVTGDRDAFQLVTDDVSVLYTATRSGSQFADVTPAYIKEKYGVSPEALITVKALMGDKSDNIPGIAGIGEKTALRLVKEYPTLEDLYAHVDALKGKLKERVVLGKESAYTSLFLGTINTHVPLETPVTALAAQPLLNDKSQDIMQTLGFRSVLARMEAPEKVALPARTRSAVALDKANDVVGCLSKLSRAGSYIVNYYAEDDALYLALEVDGFYYTIADPARVRQFVCGLSEIPNADAVQTTGHNLKTLQKHYNARGGTIANFTFDTYIASYLNDPSNGQYDLSAIAQRCLDLAYPSEEDVFGKGKSKKMAADVGAQTVCAWLATGCEIIKKVRPMLQQKIDDDGMSVLFSDIELALEPVLADMEEAGFKIDLDMLGTLSQDFARQLQDIEQEIYDLADVGPFNIGSPKQLGEVLFEKLGLPAVKKTKTGYSTNAQVLEELRPYHPIIEKILQWRQLSKLDSTYGKGLIAFIDPKTDKIHTTLQQTVTATGRISSTDPNLQNIPVKTEMGREIRKAFIASAPDRVLVDADYSQIELRILAALSGDEALIEAFKHHADIHTATAAKVFNETVEAVTPLQRRFAKTINFGLIYGKQAFTLAKDLGITRKEAQDFIDAYFATYPQVGVYLKQSIESAKKLGYAETIWGRRRYLPEINSRNRMIVQSGERMALNMPIQGAAADIMKLAMIGVHTALKAENLDADMILQVHDELIIDCAEDQAERVKALLVDKMEHAARLDVPLVVEAHIGKNWYEAK